MRDRRGRHVVDTAQSVGTDDAGDFTGSPDLRLRGTDRRISSGRRRIVLDETSYRW
jgi:hypothetical protein